MMASSICFSWSSFLVFFTGVVWSPAASSAFCEEGVPEVTALVLGVGAVLGVIHS